MKTVRKIDTSMPVLPARKRVAAYARVSAETDRTMHSLSSQVSFYNDFIQSNPEWIFAGVYADNFISGTDIERRPEFKRLLADCDAGKIDIILTKSISRFARNTVDLLETVRHLKEMGIEVHFEKEGIHSFSEDGELMLTLLASFAQEESRSISENVKWAVQKHFEQGLQYGHPNIIGYRWEGDQLVVIPEEAAIVRRIFQNFLDGKSRLETERELNAEGITTKQGCKWQDSNIRVVLTNITYTGNLLLQKEYIENPFSKKRRKNKGELTQYFVQDTHEAIIDMETFQFVQSEMARRKELGCFANKSLTLNCFSTKIKCGECGRSFVRSKRKNRAKDSQWGEEYVFWECTSAKKNNCPRCHSGTILESLLKAECAKVMGIPEFDESIFAERVRQITIPETGIMLFQMTDETTMEHRWENTAKKESWTEGRRQEVSEYRRNHAVKRSDITCFTTKIKCAHCGVNFRKQTSKTTMGPVGYWCCSVAGRPCGTPSLRDDFLRPMAAEVLGLPEFDETVFLERVDQITVDNQKQLTFIMKDGSNVQRVWNVKRQSPKWSLERRAKFEAAPKRIYTEEERKAIGDRVRKIRSEKHWSNKGKS